MATGTRRRTPGRRAALIEWRKQDESFISQTIKDALKVPFIRDGTGGIQDIFPADAYPAVLAAIIEIQGVSRVYTKRELVLSALRRLARYKKQDLAAFRRALAAEVLPHVALTEETYHIVFPVNMERAVLGRRPFNVLGLRFRPMTWRHLARIVASSDWLRELPRLHAGNQLVAGSQFTPLAAIVDARTYVQAFTDAKHQFSLLQAVLNMYYTFARHHLQMGPPQPLGKVLRPPASGVFASDGAYVTTFINTLPPASYSLVRPTAKHLEYVHLHLKRLREPSVEGGTRALLVDAIRLYGDALDTVDWRKAFLSLWQVLELMTYRGKGDFSMRNVHQRAESLLGGNELLKRVLRLAYDTRNELVHRGEFPDEQVTDVALLKAVVETCIMRLDSLARDFPTWPDLELYYTYARTQQDDLDRTGKTIRKIQRRRSRTP